MSAYCTEDLRYLSEQVCQRTVLSICIIYQSNKYVSVLYWALYVELVLVNIIYNLITPGSPGISCPTKAEQYDYDC